MTLVTHTVTTESRHFLQARRPPRRDARNLLFLGLPVQQSAVADDGPAGGGLTTAFQQKGLTSICRLRATCRLGQ
jgi:hypothetical protein